MRGFSLRVNRIVLPAAVLLAVIALFLLWRFERVTEFHHETVWQTPESFYSGEEEDVLRHRWGMTAAPDGAIYISDAEESKLYVLNPSPDFRETSTQLRHREVVLDKEGTALTYPAVVGDWFCGTGRSSYLLVFAISSLHEEKQEEITPRAEADLEELVSEALVNLSDKEAVGDALMVKPSQVRESDLVIHRLESKDNQHFWMYADLITDSGIYRFVTSIAVEKLIGEDQYHDGIMHWHYLAEKRESLYGWRSIEIPENDAPVGRISMGAAEIDTEETLSSDGSPAVMDAFVCNKTIALLSRGEGPLLWNLYWQEGKNYGVVPCQTDSNRFPHVVACSPEGFWLAQRRASAEEESLQWILYLVDAAGHLRAEIEIPWHKGGHVGPVVSSVDADLFYVMHSAGQQGGLAVTAVRRETTWRLRGFE